MPTYQLTLGGTPTPQTITFGGNGATVNAAGYANGTVGPTPRTVGTGLNPGAWLAFRRLWAAVNETTGTASGGAFDGHGDAAADAQASVVVDRPLDSHADAASGAQGSAAVARPVDGHADAASGAQGSLSVTRPVAAHADAAAGAQAPVTPTQPTSPVRSASRPARSPATPMRRRALRGR
jgi:hypothetical protein